MSDGDLEGKCEETDELQISTSGIPIIREKPLLKIEDDSIQDSGVYGTGATNENTAAEQADIKAPLGDPMFWLWFYASTQSHVLEKTILDKILYEARGEILEASVKREYEEKTKLEEALKAENHDKIGIFVRYIHRIYLHRLEESDREYAEESLVKANERVKALESNELMQMFVKLGLSNKIEEQEQTIREYAKRFGTPESLWKLKAAEENRAMNGQNLPKYQSIEELLTYYCTGKLPKTTGQRVMDFLEKIANPDTYHNIAQAVYRAFRKK